MTAPARTPVVLVLALWAAGLGAAGQFAKIAVIFPDLRALYPGAGPEIGFLVSLISFLGIALGLFAGLVVARIGFRRILIAALILGAAVSAFQAALPPLPVMLATRLVEGLSHLVIVVAAPTLIGQVTAPRHRPYAMTLWSTFFGVAFAVTAWAGLPLVEASGVPALFLAHAVIMILAAGILFALLPPQRALPETAPLSLRLILRRHVEIYRSPFRAAPAIGWLFYTLTFVSLITILPDYVAPEERALITGLMPLAGIAASLSLGVLLLRVLPPLAVIMTGFSLAATAVLVLAADPGNGPVSIGLFAALGLVQCASFAAIPALNPEPEAQAHANGALAQMGNLGNTLGTPILLAMTGWLGHDGLVLFALLAWSGGIAAHLVLARMRV